VVHAARAGTEAVSVRDPRPDCGTPRHPRGVVGPHRGR
jgi:hypothetical protein